MLQLTRWGEKQVKLDIVAALALRYSTTQYCYSADAGEAGAAPKGPLACASLVMFLEAQSVDWSQLISPAYQELEAEERLASGTSAEHFPG